MSELKPCPFCGSDEVSLSYSMNVENVVSGRFVECEDCMACGPVYLDTAIAVAAWNRRPYAPRAGEVDDFCQRVADSDWLDADLNAVAVNVLHSRIPDAETRRTAVSAIRTLQDILRDAKALPAPPQADGAQG